MTGDPVTSIEFSAAAVATTTNLRVRLRRVVWTAKGRF
jgi:hypothetical protein